MKKKLGLKKVTVDDKDDAFAFEEKPATVADKKARARARIGMTTNRR
jgi:hypothetical protein